VRPPLESLERAAGGDLPDDPSDLRRWLAADGARAPLPTLHRLVERIRACEATRPNPSERGRWMTARAAAHTVLAGLGSTVALYDLREAIEGGEEVPAEMLAALDAIGDRSCLEAIAGAYARLTTPSAAGGDPGDSTAWWREHLAATFRRIAARENLGERHAVTRRIRARWPEAALTLIGPPGARRPGTSRLARVGR